MGFNALSRTSAERKALLRNLATSFFRHERIETTLAKAKEVQRMVEKMITRAKTDSVHNRRIIARDIYDEAVTAKLFKEIGPLYADVAGGYTRIIKTQNRLGDAAEMAILDLTKKTASYEEKLKAQEKLAKKKAREGE
ncbi:MAG: 50S ribosomal protein L17 [Spirochaetales bacterium]|nr:50S ribosomal protein L17 [Spirochaetales bacterium]